MQPSFLSCDWGTSHFRLRLVEADSLSVLAEIKTNQGVGKISGDLSAEERRLKFERIIVEHAETLFEQTGLVAQTCVISGMVSSTIGWHELAYVSTPLPIRAEDLSTCSFEIGLGSERVLRIILVSGIRSSTDVMRGEESELLGLLKLLPDLRTSAACLIMPGTHCKHLCLENGVLVDFTTYMTGELYAQLQTVPTLKGPLSGDLAFSEADFITGVDQVIEEGLSASLFQVRTRSVLAEGEPADGKSFLSGLLIGAELAALDHEMGMQVYLCCSHSLLRPYALAAERLGLPLRVIPPEIISSAIVRAHHCLLADFLASSGKGDLTSSR